MTTVGAQTQERLQYLKRLADNGLLNTEEDIEYRRLRAGLGAGTVDRPANAPQASNGAHEADDEAVEVPLNIDAYEQGWSSFTPPQSAGIFPSICDGIVVQPLEDRAMVMFRNAPGASQKFRGSMMVTGLTKKEGSVAGKLKDIVTALGGTAVSTGTGMRISGIKGKPAKTDWQLVEIKGQKQLRIQNVYAADYKVEQAI